MGQQDRLPDVVGTSDGVAVGAADGAEDMRAVEERVRVRRMAIRKELIDRQRSEVGD